MQQLRLQDSRKQPRRGHPLQGPREVREAGQDLQCSQGQPQSNVDNADSLTPNTKDGYTMPLWIARDPMGLSLFVGTNPPNWDGAYAVQNCESDAGYMGQVPPDGTAIQLKPGECYRAELQIVAMGKASPVTAEMTELTEAVGVATD